MKVAVIGTGYVGLVTGVSLSALGHEVICVGRNKEKIAAINYGASPFFEPGLDEYIRKYITSGNLKATDDFNASVIQSDVIILAVGTPTKNNEIDLSEIKAATAQIGKILAKNNTYKVVVVKSTVVPTTTESVVLPILEKESKKKIGAFGLCMNPEFLREGNAVEDALHPDRIVIGAYDRKSAEQLKKIYQKFTCPIILTNLRTAELIKYASNALLATMISYSNEIAGIAEEIGDIDAVDVWGAVHLDGRLSPIVNGKRIVPAFLSYIYSGCGYGGSCFPKDTKALASFAKKNRIHSKIIDTVIDINSTQPQRVFGMLEKSLKNIKGKTIAILGLSFKPNTDDMRESPSLALISQLKKHGALVRVTDPQAYKTNKTLVDGLGVEFFTSFEKTLLGCDAAVIMTAWDEYKKITPAFYKKMMKKPVIVDGRRIYNKEQFIKEGIEYTGIGYQRVQHDKM